MTLNSMPARNRYGALAAEIYDLDKPIGSLPDTRFYLDRLKDCDGPILEPACGSGRSLAPMLEAGLDVFGFDRSPDMLERCRATCRQRNLNPKVDQQAFEDFRYDQLFAAVVVPVGTFTLIADRDAALSVLKRFRQALQPGGLLLIDLPSLRYLADDADDRRHWTADNGDLLTLEGHRTKTDWMRQSAVETLRYERWREGRLIESAMELLIQRFWGLSEFTREVKEAGFEAVTVVGSYDRSRGPSSADLTFTVEAIAGSPLAGRGP